MTPEDTLYPCLMCGSTRVMAQADIDPPKVYIICKKCGHKGFMISCKGIPTTDDIIEAVIAWNKEVENET